MNPDERIKELFHLYKHGNLTEHDKEAIRDLITEYKNQKGIRKLKIFRDE